MKALNPERRAYNKRSRRDKLRLVAKYRKAKKGTKGEILRAAGITATHISSWEKQEAAYLAAQAAGE
jgi:hypothetical protein